MKIKEVIKNETKKKGSDPVQALGRSFGVDVVKGGEN